MPIINKSKSAFYCEIKQCPNAKNTSICLYYYSLYFKRRKFVFDVSICCTFCNKQIKD